MPAVPRPAIFWAEDLEEARQTLHEQGYLPRVKRGHKAELRRLTCTLSNRSTQRSLPRSAATSASNTAGKV